MNIKDDTKITNNFIYNELYGKRNDNKPENTEQFLNLIYGVTTILQPIRDKFGKLHITSGRRSVVYNKSIGGVATSDHITGNAFDIQLTGVDNFKVYTWIINNLNYDKLIFERRGNTEWLHISFRRIGENRKLNYVSLEKNVYKVYNGQSLEKVV